MSTSFLKISAVYLYSSYFLFRGCNFSKNQYYNSMLNKKGENKMLNIFEKKKLILTEWDSSPESKKNFKKAIKKLKAENIPFIIVEKRLINELGKKVYISYSVVMDTILLITVILAILNADKILKVLS